MPRGSQSVARTISVAMATYNGAKYLMEQLQSIALQSRQPTELVVSDDASSDATPQVLAEFSRSAPFPVVVHSHSSNVGYARNFERALRSCVGDIVLFADQDDVWLPRKIERVAATMDANPGAHLVIHDRLFVDANLQDRGVTSLSLLRSRRLPVRMYVAGSATAVSRPLANLAVPLPELSTGAVGHDEWVHHLARTLNVAVLVQEPLMLYRRHGENYSRSAHEPFRSALRSWFAEFRRFASSLNAARTGSRQAKIVAQLELQHHLHARLQRAPEGLFGQDAQAAARRARKVAASIEQRLEVMRSPWRLARVVAADRVRRAGAYASTPNGVATLLMDVLSVHSTSIPSQSTWRHLDHEGSEPDAVR